MTDLSAEDLQAVIDALQPLVATIVQETLRAQRAQRAPVTVTMATIESVDGPDLLVVPDDAPTETVQVTRAVAAHAEGLRVPILHYPPSGGLALPAVPEPT